jgi:DNA polymerase III sliding clamp (beta) subunit (PCNA family)
MQKEALLKALETVRPGLASKEMIEQSTSFAFMSDRVVTYNDEISISHPVEGLDIEGAIKAEELYKLLSKLKGDELKLKKTAKEITITSDKTTAGITLQSEIKLPLEEIGELGKWKILPEGFVDKLTFCLFSCSRDMGRPVLTCIHVNKAGYIESCDNLRLTHSLQGEEMPVDTFLIPQSSAQQLVKYGVNKIAEGKGWVHFKTEEGTIFSCRIFQDNFPDTSKILEVEGKEITLPHSMDNIIDRASIFSKREYALDEEVEVIIEDGQMTVWAQSDTGWIKEETKVRYRGDKISFSINPKFLKEILPIIRKGVLGENKIKFVGDNWQHVISLNSKAEE